MSCSLEKGGSLIINECSKYLIQNISLYNIYHFFVYLQCKFTLQVQYNVNIEFSIKTYFVEIYLTELLGFKIIIVYSIKNHTQKYEESS